MRPERFLRLIDQSDFNPRTPVGCDACTAGNNVPVIFQSTHPSGVRRKESVDRFWNDLFQSTHPSGVRRDRRSDGGARMRFQSTHPSGVRPAGPNNTAAPESDFNPRTPVGCDPSGRSRAARPRYFNPRTPVGCDSSTMTTIDGFEISIHAPQWGATWNRPRWKRLRIYFNPRTPVGCDRSLKAYAGVA